MPYEISLRVQLSAIDTEDEAVILFNRVREVITNAFLTANGIPFSDLLVSNHSVTEYDEETEQVIRVVFPPAMLPRELEDRIAAGIRQARQGETKDLGDFSQYLD